MGCVHGKCCSRYPNSWDSDALDIQKDSPFASNNIHLNGNHQYIQTDSSLDLIDVPSHKYHLEYSALTQRGYYPGSPDKENQDCFCVITRIQSNPNLHFFGVFDGHGQFGTQCANLVRDRLVEILSEDPKLIEDPVKAYNSAFLDTNYELHNSEIDDTMSGTTAITVLVCGNTLFIANVGDSRAVLGVKRGGRVIAEDLSDDQTPFRKDEYERVKLSGARVLSVDQVEGVKDPDVQAWGDEESDGGDPPRLWVQNGMYPGTAFTRSVGDSTAETIGVVAVPEVSIVTLKPEHLFFVIASDGVFEFLSSQAVVDMIPTFGPPPANQTPAILSFSYFRFCSPYFWNTTYKATYAGYIAPSLLEEDWDEPSHTMLPPIRNTQPGRPRVNRRRLQGENAEVGEKISVLYVEFLGTIEGLAYMES